MIDWILECILSVWTQIKIVLAQLEIRGRSEWAKK